MSTVSSRVVAEIYRGIDFPIGWADRPDVIGRGMAATEGVQNFV